MLRSVLLACIVCCLWLATPGRAAEIDFAHDIVPILRQHCVKCHAGEKREGAFSINTRELLLAGGENGKAVIPGKSGESEFYLRVVSKDGDMRMPPEGPAVPAKDAQRLQAWIDAGAPWEAGFTFGTMAYEPPLKPRIVTLPPVVDGRTNPLDRLIDAYLDQHKLPRPETISDAAFLRRVSLDLVGLLPTPEQQAAFLADQRPDKRACLVRELLANDIAYADHWLTFWNDLLRNDYTGTGFITGGRKQITKWLYQALRENKPYDQFVRELIAPSADSEGFAQGIRWRGTVNASQTVEVQFAQSISQAFLGINMKCASCHDSFVDRWKLSEAYGLAAVYATEPLAVHRCDKPTGKVAEAAWIFPELGQINAQAPQPERLQQLAALMTHRENGRLTRTVVNRLWHRLLGRGIVHPTDAMHTQPWNEDLLDYLAADFAEQGYDLKHTLELICTSQAYQARTPALAKELDNTGYRYQGPLAKRMTAEQFVDAVWQITGTAPTKAAAEVSRTPMVAGSKPKPAPPVAKWIWSSAKAATAAPKGELFITRFVWKLNAKPARVNAAITCDNEYVLYINGKKVAADENWETIDTPDLQPHLQAGDNDVVIVAKNGGNSPNPAALFMEARATFADGSETILGTNDQWQMTASLPDASGRFTAEPTDWKPAVVIATPNVWSGRVETTIGELLTGGAHNGPMIRASLVKSDDLMRSLGRPNRDQIVSMRPTDLTTLEAIDLANGQTFAILLTRGGQNLTQKPWKSPEELIRWLYRSALTREPSPSELATAQELLGDKPTADSTADLLWALFMLPEFQLIR